MERFAICTHSGEYAAAPAPVPRLVGGVRLAGEEEQHRPLAVGEDAAQDVEVVEQQRCPLVRGEAPAEADREDVGLARVGEAQQPPEVRLAAVVARMLLSDAV